MDVKELRVGNCVLNDGALHRLSPIDIYNHSINLDSGFKPIELTEDILVKKCGFEKIVPPNGWVFYDNINPRFRITKHPHRNDIYHLFGYENTVPFSYLHQLQNLYFALVGKELDVKL